MNVIAALHQDQFALPAEADVKQAPIFPVLLSGGSGTLVHRHWGHFQTIELGECYRVKPITVNPGAKLSLQKHCHRAELWVVANGTAAVTRDGEALLLKVSESVFLPVGCIHRLENPGRIPLNLIEIQSGAYFSEDDIVRFEDLYARGDVKLDRHPIG